MIKDGWYCCKDCGQKLFKVDKAFVISGIEIKCKKCKQILKINTKSQ